MDDDYRRYRQQGSDNSAKNELFQGATNNRGPPPPYGGYQQPQYGGYQQPQYGGYQQPQYGGYQQPQYGGYQQQEEEEDVESIKSQIHGVKQDSVNSTLKSLQMIDQAEQSGQNTLNKLGEQSR
jgi:hypothetical protein